MQPGSGQKSEVLRFQIRSKDVLAPDESELYELSELAGIRWDPSVFKIILDLLRLNVAPMAIMQMLKLMCDPKEQKAATEIHSYSSTSPAGSSLLHSPRATAASSRHRSHSREKR